MNKIVLVFGTRPEMIKLAPVIDAFGKRGQQDRLFIVHTGQHSELLRIDLDHFGIAVDYTFTLEREGDSLSLLNGQLLLEFHKLRAHWNEEGIHPSALVAVGDTASAFAAAQFAFYERIPFMHVEAGLRTGDLSAPFPEEYFRKTMASIAALHFAPTAAAVANLLAEHVSPEAIRITGNTVIDNLRRALETGPQRNGIADKKLVLITIHRRENILYKLDAIRRQVLDYCMRHPEKRFVWIDNPGYKLAAEIVPRPANLEVIDPVCFATMLAYYRHAELIVTDSGGIQEEACYLGIPALIFREKTEREESIACGPAKYFDNDPDLDTVISALQRKKTDASRVLFGDGTAAEKICQAIAAWEQEGVPVPNNRR